MSHRRAFSHKEWRRLILVGLLALAVLVLSKHFDSLIAWLQRSAKLFSPVALGIVLAFILNLPMRFLERKTPLKKVKRLAIRRTSSLLVSLIFYGVMIYLIIQTVLPNLIEGINLLVAQTPMMLSSFQQWLDKTASEVPWLRDWLTNQSFNWGGVGRNLVNYLWTSSSNLLNRISDIALTLSNGLFQFLLAMMLAIYLLMSKENLARQCRRLLRFALPGRYMRVFEKTMSVATEVFTAYTVGQLTMAALLGFCCSLGATLLGLPYAPMSGAALGVSSLIPLFGTYIGGGIGIFMIATVSIRQALIYLIFILILQQIITNLIYPRIVGRSIGLPGFWVLIAVIAGGGIGGIAGIILSVPLAATAYQLIAYYFQTHPDSDLEQRRLKATLARSLVSSLSPLAKVDSPSISKTETCSEAPQKDAASSPTRSEDEARNEKNVEEESEGQKKP